MTREFSAAEHATLWRWMPHAGSTNDELRHFIADGDVTSVPDFTVFATDDQRAGRGRMDRVWVSPPGVALACSVAIRLSPPGGRTISDDAWGWFSLIAGLAMTQTIRELVPPSRSVHLKWPNDVLIDGRKVSGILCELVSDSLGHRVIIIGVGVNLTQDESSLPVPTATSLRLAGAQSTDVDDVLRPFLIQLRRIVRAFEAASGDAVASGLHALVEKTCTTVGQRVRIVLPGDSGDVVGLATGVDTHGQLLVTVESPVERAGDRMAVSVGDVTHVTPV